MTVKATANLPLSPPGAEPGNRVRSIDSQALLGSAREVRIHHQGENYTLRLTRLGKLILTK